MKITGYLGPMLSQMPVLHSVSSSLILALVSRSCLVPESLCLPRPNCAARRVRGARRSRAPSGGAYGTPEDTRPAPIPEVDRERRWFITERLSLHLDCTGSPLLGTICFVPRDCVSRAWFPDSVFQSERGYAVLGCSGAADRIGVAVERVGGQRLVFAGLPCALCQRRCRRLGCRLQWCSRCWAVAGWGGL